MSVDLPAGVLETLHAFLCSLSSFRQMGERLRLQSEAGFFCVFTSVFACSTGDPASQQLLLAAQASFSFFFFCPLKTLLCGCQACKVSIPETHLSFTTALSPVCSCDMNRHVQHHTHGPWHPGVTPHCWNCSQRLTWDRERPRSYILFTPGSCVTRVSQIWSRNHLRIKTERDRCNELAY